MLHDDFGLATANTLEGLRAGAMGCDVTFNRTGHRCGNAAFEQIAVGVEYFFGYETKLDLSKITEVSKLVSELYEVPVPANAPIVGWDMFSYGGLHIPGMLRGDWCLWGDYPRRERRQQPPSDLRAERPARRSRQSTRSQSRVSRENC